jgi:hypothetical protein
MATITRGSDFGGERYKYDERLSPATGWAQVDTKQDASYYGTWANPITFEIFNYCEGDTTLTKCDSAADFVAEMTKTIEWNREAGYWLGIDPGWPDRPTTEKITEAFTRLGFGDALH